MYCYFRSPAIISSSGIVIILLYWVCFHKYGIGSIISTAGPSALLEFKQNKSTQPNKTFDYFVLLWTYTYLESYQRKYNCGTHNCIVTSDKALLNKSDALFFNSRFVKEEQLPKRHGGNKLWILSTFESPNHRPSLFPAYLNNKVNITATYHRNSPIPLRYGYSIKCGTHASEVPFDIDGDIKAMVINQLGNQAENVSIPDIYKMKSEVALWAVSDCGKQVHS